MLKRMLVFGCALVFAALITGCGDKIDEDEQREAEQLVTGLNMMAMMTNVDAYSTTGLDGAPFGWTGPFVYELPDWTDTLYYEYFIKLPLDSIDVFIDSIIWLVMPEPNVWGPDSLEPWTGIDTWIIGKARTDIYFHTTFSVEDTLAITGLLRWNWSETWYQYDYDVSMITEAADIDITTSSNIGLAAHFLFADDGSGTVDDCYAEWNNTIFVRYEFFDVPNAEEYDGYYELLSEAWKVQHFFKLTKEESTM
ncbi:hypothetical protein JXB22_10895 [candidate division WOR-3 bacterium]|nr:hypothetical protein [candidate division WOR-3 bacterium]